MSLKATVWQGALLGVILAAILVLTNNRLVRGLFRTDSHYDDFQYRDSVFIVYRGPFQDFPWLAAAFWFALILIASIIALTIFKKLWFALRQRSLASNR
ncbi:hypothetical protein EV294_104202 [Paenibacillus sp. BK033]|uniref:hypothetical protein n=1 Tax=Paenibacillus sp. BK033 TaxID=2512133 RepID=UPI00104B5892|nr:hypothetical protein [Paenibacillus sp. BK033]TCM96991.1 hypothetical protein EV294_104202 [Paenibacillus sp. BK033]